MLVFYQALQVHRFRDNITLHIKNQTYLDIGGKKQALIFSYADIMK